VSRTTEILVSRRIAFTSRHRPDFHPTVIREYALLAVRNLMINNVANQAVIKEMDPVGMVGPDGELREMPARMGAKK
jgi:hypothetical protein